MRFRLFFALSSSMAVMLMAVGCGGEKLPSLGRVTGTVTLDGQPVPDATVIFDPAQPGEAAVIARTDDTGKYELYYSRGHKGTTLGEHIVHISNYQAPTDESAAKKETLPAKYNAKSELKATVNRGANKIDFDLKSGGEIIQPDEEDQPAKKGKKAK